MPDPHGPTALSARRALSPARAAADTGPAVVAFYLPQYHPIPENDAWWGPGFTDWDRVRSARPIFRGHAVPNVPADLGYYDLRDRSVRQLQAELAHEHGIYAFCYYFYWFGGRRLLERPLESMLTDGQPDLPFCLCWANEPWSRRWDGRAQDILMPQDHHRVHDLAILDDLMPFFRDPRYVRVDGRPLLLIYRQALLDDAAGFTAQLRKAATAGGLEGLFLCNVMSIGDREGLADGFDAAVEFPPNGVLVTELDRRQLRVHPGFRGHIYDYASVASSAMARPTYPFPYFPGVMPRWDNSARKGMASEVFHGSTPEAFEGWLRRAGTISSHRHPGAPLVFVNAWNEWAEGAHLEPDQRTGREYLRAVQRVTMPDVGEAFARAHPVGSHAGRATGSGPELSPLATPMRGSPDLGDTLVRTSTTGSAWLDTVDGVLATGRSIVAPEGSVVRLRGWLLGHPRCSGRRRDAAYLLLTSELDTWHVAIPRRHRRTDVRRSTLARDRRTRRFVRAIDRLPRSLARWGVRLWAHGRDHLGFDIGLRLHPLPTGRYRAGFIDSTAIGAFAIETEFILEVTAGTAGA